MIRESLSALDKSITDFGRDTPFFHRTLSGQSNIAGAGSFLIDLGNPSQGKLWCLTSIALFSNVADYSPVPNLTGATVYISPSSDSVTSALVLIPAFGTAAAPGFQTFGNDTVYQYPTEHMLISIVSSGASGAFAVARVKEFAIDDLQPRRI